MKRRPGNCGSGARASAVLLVGRHFILAGINCQGDHKSLPWESVGRSRSPTWSPHYLGSISPHEGERMKPFVWQPLVFLAGLGLLGCSLETSTGGGKPATAELRKIEIKEGTGAAAEVGDKVEVHYVGTFKDG